jgi:hypothetical protein
MTTKILNESPQYTMPTLLGVLHTYGILLLRNKNRREDQPFLLLLVTNTAMMAASLLLHVSLFMAGKVFAHISYKGKWVKLFQLQQNNLICFTY